MDTHERFDEDEYAYERVIEPTAPDGTHMRGTRPDIFLAAAKTGRGC